MTGAQIARSGRNRAICSRPRGPAFDISNGDGSILITRSRWSVLPISGPSPLSGRFPVQAVALAPRCHGYRPPGAAHSSPLEEVFVLFEIEHLSDADLLSRVHDLTHQDHLATARFVAHLAELDSRRLYVAEGFPSLFAYCTQVLHFSEYTAYRRIESARVARRFPVVLERIADGSVHLTAITLLAPHLTPENHLALLESARHRTRRQIESILAHLIPGRERPVRGYVVPLPPTGSITPHAIERGPGVLSEAAGRTVFRGGLLDAGSASRTSLESVAGSPGGNGDTSGLLPLSQAAPGAIWSHSAGCGAGDLPGLQCPEIGNRRRAGSPSVETQEAPSMGASHATPGPGAESPAEGVGVEDAGSYRLHVTIGASTYRRLERARLLMSHSNPSGDIATVLDRALGALVDILERRKFAQVRTTRKTRHQDAPATRAVGTRAVGGQSGRHIPASVRRAVWQRDAGQCTFVGQSGNRCRAHAMLEYHHVVAWARGGDSTTENLTLRCRTHNAHDAEQSMGRRFRPTRTGASCSALLGASCSALLGVSCSAPSDPSSGRPASREPDHHTRTPPSKSSWTAGHHPGTDMKGPAEAEQTELLEGSPVTSVPGSATLLPKAGGSRSSSTAQTPVKIPRGSHRADSGAPVGGGGTRARHAGRRSSRRSERRRRRSP